MEHNELALNKAFCVPHEEMTFFQQVLEQVVIVVRASLWKCGVSCDKRLAMVRGNEAACSAYSLTKIDWLGALADEIGQLKLARKERYKIQG